MRGRWCRLLGWGLVLILGALPLLAQQPAAWQLLDDGDPPTNINYNSSFVYDSTRDVAVQLHRLSVGPVITWELVGDEWTRRALPAPNLGIPCTSFDPDRGVTVLFAGRDETGTYTSQTWEYDGTTWVQRVPLASPPPRSSCAMAYDKDRRVMVLFGGYTAPFSGTADTWEYDGTNWVEVSTRNAPSSRGEAALTYDQVRREMVLFGGRHLNQVSGGTWTYDGRNWRQKNTGAAPASRSAAGLVYDPGLDKTILFGGYTPVSVFGDTWEWSGTSWTELTPPTSPPDRSCKLVYDNGRQKVLLHGGRWDDGGYNDTWVFDGITWSQIAVSTLPKTRSYHALAYDPQRDALVLYGGRVSGPDGPVSAWDTWTYAGGAWTEETGAGAPTASSEFGLAFSESIEGLVGFSGRLPNFSTVDEYHELTGNPAVWSSFSGFQPDRRFAHGWTSAPALGGVVMFGGGACCQPGGISYLANDTWVFDGVDWHEKFPSTSPPGRLDAPLAFDAGAGKVVLYGGLRENGVTDASTWLFDGTEWQEWMTTSPPGNRDGHSMAYDASRGVVVLFGAAATGDEGVTWEFDGTQWTARQTPFQPETNRRWTPLAYDSKREVVMLFGGHAGPLYNDTWAYGSDPDGDGIVGGLDNCRQTANSDQANGDGDPAGDACDCASADPGSFAPPVEVNHLLANGSATTVVSWDDQSPLVGSEVTYDLVTGSIQDLRSAGNFSAATCLEGGLTVASYGDGRSPAAGDGFYYLSRATNVCGAGTYGPGRAGLDGSGPCP